MAPAIQVIDLRNVLKGLLESMLVSWSLQGTGKRFC